MVRSIFLIISMCVLPGCVLFGESEGPKYEYNLWMSVDSLDVIEVAGGEVEFLCHTTVGDPCHEFHRADIERGGDEVTIRLYSKRERAAICPQVISALDVPLEVEVDGGKTYTFHFWRLGEASLDTTLYAPE